MCLFFRVYRKWGQQNESPIKRPAAVVALQRVQPFMEHPSLLLYVGGGWRAEVFSERPYQDYHTLRDDNEAAIDVSSIFGGTDMAVVVVPRSRQANASP